jgi:hypothetical protein
MQEGQAKQMHALPTLPGLKFSGYGKKIDYVITRGFVGGDRWKQIADGGRSTHANANWQDLLSIANT